MVNMIFMLIDKLFKIWYYIYIFNLFYTYLPLNGISWKIKSQIKDNIIFKKRRDVFYNEK